VDTHGATAAGVEENVDAVKGVSVHGRHDPARVVGADGDEAEVEGTAEGADLREGRAVRVGVVWGVVVFGGGEGGHGAVACVAVMGGVVVSGVVGGSGGMWGGIGRGGEGGVEGISHPPNQTFLPPLSTLQLAQSVCPLSKGVRALVCWQGRQPMRATTCSGVEASGSMSRSAEDPSLETRTDFSPAVGDRAMSRSSHQSSSVTLEMPEAVNQALLPSGTKKCTFGWRARMRVMVGWSMWS